MHYRALILHSFYGFSLSTMAMTMTVQAAALNNALKLSSAPVR